MSPKPIVDNGRSIPTWIATWARLTADDPSVSDAELNKIPGFNVFFFCRNNLFYEYEDAARLIADALKRGQLSASSMVTMNVFQFDTLVQWLLEEEGNKR